MTFFSIFGNENCLPNCQFVLNLWVYFCCNYWIYNILCPPHRKNIHREISEFICIDYILCMSNVGFVSIQLTLFLHVWMYSTFEIVISKKQRCKENEIKSWSPLFTNVIFVYCCPIMIYVNITSEYFIIPREIRLHNR